MQIGLSSKNCARSASKTGKIRRSVLERTQSNKLKESMGIMTEMDVSWLSQGDSRLSASAR
jgi:hypothetical protein